jgi:hypothetical protein
VIDGHEPDTQNELPLQSTHVVDVLPWQPAPESSPTPESPPPPVSGPPPASVDVGQVIAGQVLLQKPPPLQAEQNVSPAAQPPEFPASDPDWVLPLEPQALTKIIPGKKSKRKVRIGSPLQPAVVKRYAPRDVDVFGLRHGARAREGDGDPLPGERLSYPPVAVTDRRTVTP